MTTQTTDATARASATRRRAIVVGAAVPIVITAIAAVVSASWIPDLPDPVAVHWGGDTPDGFGNVWPFVLTPLLACGALAIFVTVFGSRPTPAGLLTPQQKFLLVTSVWMAGLLSVGLGGTLWVQRGLDDAAEASGGAIWMLWGLIAAFTLAVGAWFVLPESDRTVVTGTAPTPIEVSPTELVAWSRTVGPSRTLWGIVGGVLLLEFVVALVFASSGSSAWLMIVPATIVLLLVTATFQWRVTADRRGLTARSALGWPRTSIPLDEIADVSIVDIEPVAEFGGWGWRLAADGRRGIVMQRGEAIQVTRTNGRRFVVTVDDAATGAAVLESMRTPH